MPAEIPAVRIGYPMLADLEMVAYGMRADERAQWCASTGRARYDADLFAREMAAVSGPSWSLVDAEGRPFAVGGLEPLRPMVMRAWAAGTPEGWEAHGIIISRVAARIIRQVLRSGEAHRIEVVSMAARTRAHRWYEKALGMAREGLHKQYFADGSDAVSHAITKEAPPHG